MSLWEQFTHDVHVIDLFADFDTLLVRLEVCKLQYLQYTTQAHFNVNVNVNSRFVQCIIAKSLMRCVC